MAQAGWRIKSADELNLRIQYEARRAHFEALAQNARRACQAVLDASGVPYHSIKTRVKSLSSAIEKIRRKKYAASLDAVEDLVGVRIICLYPHHVDPIVALIEREFKIREKVDRRPKSSSGAFGYSSVHAVCTVKDTTRSELPEYKQLCDIPFEVQVRTILQEAWAEIEHGLIYKPEQAAPEDVRRQIARVSAVLEMADEDFQRVYELRRDYETKLKASPETELGDEPLNVDSLLEVIRRKYAWAEGWKQIMGSDLGFALWRLVDDAQFLGISTVQQLIGLIEKWNDAEMKDSERAYLIATGRKKPEKPDDSFHIERDEEWHDKTKQYFLPIGQVRGILRREFPEYEGF